MHEFQASKEIAQPIERVWPLLEDFANTSQYHPVVERSRTTNGVVTGPGARRECVMYDGGRLEEQIVEHDPLHHRYRVEVIDAGPFPLREMSVWVEATPSGSVTIVSYRGHFVPKMGPLGWLMAKLIMKRRFETMLAAVLEGIEQHLSTGRRIERGGSLGPSLRAPAPAEPVP